MASLSWPRIHRRPKPIAKPKIAKIERENFVLLTKYGAIEGSLPLDELKTLPQEARHPNDGSIGRWIFAAGVFLVGFGYGFSAIEYWTRLWMIAIIVGCLLGTLLSPIGWFTAHFWQPGPIWFFKMTKDGAIAAATYEGRDRDGVKLLSASYTYGIRDVMPIRKYFRGGGTALQKVQLALMGMILFGLIVGIILFVIFTMKAPEPLPIGYDEMGRPIYAGPVVPGVPGEPTPTVPLGGIPNGG